jgi:hypothetical protein
MISAIASDLWKKAKSLKQIQHNAIIVLHNALRVTADILRQINSASKAKK